MSDTFEVERDQDALVDACMQMLNPNGILYFSNNKRKFRLSEKVLATYKIRDITEESIPQDFHDKKIHNCFEIRPK
ncbi:Ribosomal RNA large subunit methyltransferase K [compost metagenome]